MADAASAHPRLQDVETKLLHDLRNLRRKQRQRRPGPAEVTLTAGQRLADRVADTMGSWHFIVIQTVMLTIWVVLNITAYVQHWDPYPFILLNLALSFQAAYSAPIIMMSQNRQEDIDRRNAENDHQVNVKAELEIELLHEKIDKMREQEVFWLTQSVEKLTNMLQESLDKKSSS